MKVENIAFGSRINFIDAKKFENEFRRGTYIDIRKLCSSKAKDDLFALKADEFYTDEIRTCTAGGIINSKTGECAGFHFYDDFTNSEKVGDFLNHLLSLVKNPDRALIIGSKNLKYSNYSIPIFKEIYEGISKCIPNITIFREHLFPYSESNIHYSGKNDTWDIHSMFRLRTNIIDYDLTSPDLLTNCFDEIKVAEGDEVFFDNKRVF